MAAKRKRLYYLGLAIILGLMVFVGSANAAVTKAPPDIKAGSTAGIESYQYLQDGRCFLIDGGGGIISLTGYTEAYQDVDYIMVRLYIQRWNGESWVDLGSWPFEDYGVSKVDGAKGLQVARGYYYRTKADHKLTHNGVNESAISFSEAHLIY